MVFAEATVALPLIAGYAYHRGAWRAREAKRYARLFASEAVEKR
jgi:deoxyhypusine synthase